MDNAPTATLEGLKDASMLRVSGPVGGSSQTQDITLTLRPRSVLRGLGVPASVGVKEVTLTDLLQFSRLKDHPKTRDEQPAAQVLTQEGFKEVIASRLPVLKIHPSTERNYSC